MDGKIMVMKNFKSTKVFIVFASGVLLGVIGSHCYLLWHFHNIMRGGPTGPGIRHIALDHIDSELNLTPQQRDTVEDQLKAVQQKIKQVSSSQKPLIDKKVEESILLLENDLSKEQIAKLRNLKDKLDEKWKEEQSVE